MAFSLFELGAAILAEPYGVKLAELQHLTWIDGSKYEIDRVLDIRPAPALKAGGQGDRYKVRIRGQVRYLFFERNASQMGNNIGKWFVEKKT